MNDKHSSMGDSARRLAEIRQASKEPKTEDDLILEPEGEETKAYSILSADRQRKVMLELRFLNGNAEALAYSTFVNGKFNPSVGIKMDFTGYEVTIGGRNLRPLFEGLVAQRVQVVRETDPLQAEADAQPGETVVDRITTKPID